MQNLQDIKHQGVIESVKGGLVKVRIINASACSACHAKGHCALSESKEKIIDVYDNSGSYSTGDNVYVILKKSLGYKALLLGYIVPFLILIVTLIIISSFTKKETVAGIIAILSLIPYFLALFFFRSKLQESFKFTLSRD